MMSGLEFMIGDMLDGDEDDEPMSPKSPKQQHVSPPSTTTGGPRTSDPEPLAAVGVTTSGSGGNSPGASDPVLGSAGQPLSPPQKGQAAPGSAVMPSINGGDGGWGGAGLDSSADGGLPGITSSSAFGGGIGGLGSLGSSGMGGSGFAGNGLGGGGLGGGAFGGGAFGGGAFGGGAFGGSALGGSPGDKKDDTATGQGSTW